MARVPMCAFGDARVCLLKVPLLNLQQLVDLERGVAILRHNQKCGSLLMRRRSVGGAVHAWVDPEIPAIRRCAFAGGGTALVGTQAVTQAAALRSCRLVLKTIKTL